jgi:hypothetical protein
MNDKIANALTNTNVEDFLDECKEDWCECIYSEIEDVIYSRILRITNVELRIKNPYAIQLRIEEKIKNQNKSISTIQVNMLNLLISRNNPQKIIDTIIADTENPIYNNIYHTVSGYCSIIYFLMMIVGWLEYYKKFDGETENHEIINNEVTNMVDFISYIEKKVYEYMDKTIMRVKAEHIVYDIDELINILTERVIMPLYRYNDDLY